MKIRTLPTFPFDGQQFLDAYRILWQYTAEFNCWRRVGAMNDIPLASAEDVGLMSSQHKVLIDSIPEKGGHFGIVVRPQLSLLPLNGDPIVEATIITVTKIASGTLIKVDMELGEGTGGTGVTDLTGKIAFLADGPLKGQSFVIFESTSDSIKILGDAEDAEAGDHIRVFEPVDADDDGIVSGDIMILSDSIDISCIDSDGHPIEAECEAPKFPDTLENPPGFNFKVSDLFLDTFCVQIPGCEGPAGDKGATGPTGKHGTGDGPRGAKGATGEDTTEIHKFTGVKIVDVDDIYDTAVVSLELDGPSGILTQVKSKVRTPTDDDTAEQAVTTPVYRGVTWECTDFGECVTDALFFSEDIRAAFNFEIVMPATDPIGEPDVTIAHYPKGAKMGDVTEASKLKLSALINLIIEHYMGQLEKIENEWDKQIEEYMTEKDKAAREVLAALAMELAECEWELPLEYCVGITPDDCHPGITGAVKEDDLARAPMSGYLFGEPFCEDSLAEGLGDYVVPAGAGVTEAPVVVQYPGNNAMGSETLPPGGYQIQYLRGTYQDLADPEKGYFVGSDEEYGLEVWYDVEGAGAAQTEKLPEPSGEFNKYDQESVERAYQSGPLLDKVITAIFTGFGQMHLRAPIGLGGEGIGDVVMRVIRVLPCTGTGFDDLSEYSPDELGKRPDDEGTIVEPS